MSELLSSASILLAILFAIYSFIHLSINEIFSLHPKKHAIDNREKYKEYKLTLFTKLLPLVIFSLVLTLIFLPKFIQIVNDTGKFYRKFKITFENYDTSKAAFILVTIFLAIFCIYLIITLIRFCIKLRLYKPNR